MNERSRPRTRSIALAGAAVLLVGTIAIAGILVDRVFRPTDADRVGDALPGGAPAVVDGLRVMTVADFLAARAGARADRPFAVAGWYSEAPGHSCPAPFDPVTGGVRNTTALELYCREGQTALAQFQESIVEVRQTPNSMEVSVRKMLGPWFQPVAIGPIGAEGLVTAGEKPWTPAAVVLVGHVNDARALKCPPDQVRACAERFVIDHVAWERGRTHGPTLVADPGSGLHPALTPDDVTRLTTDRLGDSPTILASVAAQLSDLGRYEPFLPLDRVQGPIAWEVRAIATVDGAPRLVTLLISDAARAVTWTSMDEPVPAPS